MSEEMLHDDELEQRLRSHYASELGQPPSPADVWTLLQEQLPSSSDGEVSSTPTVQWRPASTRPASAFPTISHETHAYGLRSVLSIVAAGLVIALFAVVLLRPFSRTGTTTTTTDAPLPAGFSVHVLTPDETLPGTALNDLQMLSADEGWAVGYHVSSNSSETVILHYAHGRWSASRDVFPNVSLQSISMLSSTDGWASGWVAGGSVDESQPGALLHYSGGHWISVQAPGHGPIGSLSMLTPRDGWAIQTDQFPSHSSLLHYDGTAWSIVYTGGMSLTSLAMLSPSEGWAAGIDGVIEHFHNGSWNRWSTKAPGTVAYITMVSPTEGWMSGIAPYHSTNPMDQRPDQMFVLHYNGHDWQSVTLPTLPNMLTVYPSATHYQNTKSSNSISAISMVSPAEGWAAGNLAGGHASILCHYSGGKWHVFPFGVNASLTKIQMLSASEGWALGIKVNYDTSNVDTAILHYTHGSWTIYKP